MSKKENIHGGRAGSKGYLYQAKIGAFFALKMLLNEDIKNYLPKKNVFKIASIQQEPIDADNTDILISSNDGAKVHLQCKTSLGGGETGTFYNALTQLFTVYKKHKEDSFVLATSSIPQTLQVAAGSILDRISKDSKLNIEANLGNEEEKSVWAIIKSTLNDDASISDFLSKVKVLTLGIDSPEKFALLRSATVDKLLTKENDFDAVWNYLCTEMYCAMSNGCSLSSEYIVQRLLDSNISLKALPQYSEDIKLLRTFSDESFSYLSAFHSLKFPESDEPVHIELPYDSKLYNYIQNYNTLITGEPGAGKSSSLYAIGEKLKKNPENEVIVFLAEDICGYNNSLELKNGLKLSHSLLDILKHISYSKPLYILTDALDAAREDKASRFILNLLTDLIENLKSNCRIICTVRSYDLKENRELQRLFKGIPVADYSNSELANVSHFKIPCLEDSDIELFLEKSDILNRYISSLDKELPSYQLLKNPFNIRLICEILRDDTNTNNFFRTPIESITKLYEIYWESRVSGSNDDLMRKFAQNLQTHYRTYLNANELDKPSEYDDLCSRGIISRTKHNQQYRLMHHILFDYVISRYIFRRAPLDLVALFVEHPEYAFSFRASLKLYFEYLWICAGLDAFWNAVAAFEEHAEMPKIAKIVGPCVAAELFDDVKELQFLLDKLGTPEGINILSNFIAYIRIKRNSADFLISGKWLQFLLKLIPLMDKADNELLLKQARLICFSYRGRFGGIYEEKNDIFNEEQASILNKFAHSLINAAVVLCGQNKDKLVWFIDSTILILVHTINCANSETKQVLREIIENRNSHLLFDLITRVDAIIKLDPVFAREIYKSIFSYYEESEDETHMSGSSKILPMRSNKRQDYNTLKYSLNEHISSFLKTSPKNATIAIIDSVDAYINDKESIDHAKVPIYYFRINEIDVKFSADASYIWDYREQSLSMDDALPQLRHFRDFIDTKAKAENYEVVYQSLDLLIKNAQWAVYWKYLLLLCQMHPDSIGKRYWEVLSFDMILYVNDTNYYAGELLKVLYPILNDDQRAQIDAAILKSINLHKEDIEKCNKKHGTDYKWQEEVKILSCIKKDLVKTVELHDLIASLEKANELRSNEANYKSYSSCRSSNDEDDPNAPEWYKNLSINNASKHSDEYLKYKEDIKGLKLKVDSGKEFDPELIEKIKEYWAIYVSGLKEPDSKNLFDGLFMSFMPTATGYINSQNDELFVFLWKMIQSYSWHNSPTPDKTLRTKGDGGHFGYSVLPRTMAAEATMFIARNKWAHEKPIEEELMTLIEAFAKDPSRDVRFQISQLWGTIYQYNKAKAKTLYDSLINDDDYVVQSSVVYSMAKWMGEDWLWNEKIRIFDADSAEDFFNASGANACLDAILMEYIYYDTPKSKVKIYSIISEPERHWIINSIFMSLRDLAVSGNDEIRRRVVDVFQRITSNTINSWNDTNLTDSSRKNLYMALERLSSLLQFSSGTYQEKHEREGKISFERRKQWFIDFREILEQLSKIGERRIAYNLMEVLRGYLKFDPQDALKLAANVIKLASDNDSFNNESLAVSQMASFIREYISTYPEEIAKDPVMQKRITAILDCFVDVGHTEAVELSFQLGDVFK